MLLTKSSRDGGDFFVASQQKHKSAVSKLTAEDQTMHRSQLGDGWQRNAATNVSYSPHAALAARESSIIRHHLMEGGSDIDLASADQLQANAVQFGDILLLSALSRPSAATVAMARRQEIIRHLEQSLAAFTMEADEEADVFDSGTSIMIPVALGNGASVIFTIQLGWKDRYGADLSMVSCRSTIDIPDDDRTRRAAWFSKACSQVAHPATKQSTPAVVCAGGEA